ncbi:MAG: hypothetical protein ABIH34_01535, partial [Nanoarchaeota archaeon]
MINGFVCTHKGAEDIALSELKRFGISCKGLTFSCTPSQLANATYYGQSFTEAGIFIGWLNEGTPPADAQTYLPASFWVRGDVDLDGEIGEGMKKLSPESTVDLVNPDVRFRLFVHGERMGLG